MLVWEGREDKAAYLLGVDPVKLKKSYVISRDKLVQLQYQIFFSPALRLDIIDRIFTYHSSHYDTPFWNLVVRLFRERN